MPRCDRLAVEGEPRSPPGPRAVGRRTDRGGARRRSGRRGGQLDRADPRPSLRGQHVVPHRARARCARAGPARDRWRRVAPERPAGAVATPRRARRRAARRTRRWPTARVGARRPGRADGTARADRAQRRNDARDVGGPRAAGGDAQPAPDRGPARPPAARRGAARAAGPAARAVSGPQPGRVRRGHRGRAGPPICCASRSGASTAGRRATQSCSPTRPSSRAHASTSRSPSGSRSRRSTPAAGSGRG